MLPDDLSRELFRGEDADLAIKTDVPQDPANVPNP